MPLDLIRPYERVVMGREALQKVAKDSKSIEVALCFRGVRDGGLLFGKYIISEDCIFEMRDREGNAFGEGCYAVLTYFNPLSSKHKAKIRMIGKVSALEEMKYRHTLLLYSKQRCVAEVIALNT